MRDLLLVCAGLATMTACGTGQGSGSSPEWGSTPGGGSSGGASGVVAGNGGSADAGTSGAKSSSGSSGGIGNAGAGITGSSSGSAGGARDGGSSGVGSSGGSSGAGGGGSGGTGSSSGGTSEGGPVGCDRAGLQAAAADYLGAVQAGNPSFMPLASSVKYTEVSQSGTITAIGQGLLMAALPVAFSRNWLDVTSCETFSEVFITGGGHAYVLGTRLAIANGAISEIYTNVTQSGDWNFDANAYLACDQAEDWSVIPASKSKLARSTDRGGPILFRLFQEQYRHRALGQPVLPPRRRQRLHARHRPGEPQLQCRHPDGSHVCHAALGRRPRHPERSRNDAHGR
jgi:hypothetical protein